MKELVEKFEAFRKKFSLLKDAIGKVIVGNDDIVEDVIVGILADGHILLEGVPGLGKTVLVKTLGQCLGLETSRIQFTPDMMPSDILGTNILEESEGGKKEFRFEKGPIFSNIILADEINRATPKTQSAMLEVMQEHHVTIAGKKHVMDQPFFVLATQNPIEMEGTYPLPEAQLDRFLFKLTLKFPNAEQLVSIVDRTTSKEDVSVTEPVLTKEDILYMRDAAKETIISSDVKMFASKLILGTHPEFALENSITKKYVRFGASPRGVQALIRASKIYAIVEGRFNVSVNDINRVAHQALRHRILLNFTAEAEGITTDGIIDKIIDDISFI